MIFAQLSSNLGADCATCASLNTADAQQACYNNCTSSTYPGDSGGGGAGQDFVSALPGIESGAASIIRALNPPSVYRPPQMTPQQLPGPYIPKSAPGYTGGMTSNTKIALAVGGGAVLLIGAALLLRR